MKTNISLSYFNITKLALVGFLLMVAGSVFADTSINTASDSCLTLSSSKDSTVVTPDQPCWGSNLSVSIGEQFAIRVSYENSGNETAKNVRVKLQPKNSGIVNQQVYTAIITADNAPSRTQSIVISSSSQVRFIYENKLAWFPRNGSASFGIPFGQNGEEIFADGLLLGDIPTGKSNRGSVVLNYKTYSPNAQNLPAGTQLLPVVGTSPVTSVGRTSATFSGYLDPKGSVSKYYFEYGKTLSLGKKSTEVNRGLIAGFVTQGISGLEMGTRYYVRNCAVSSAGTKCGTTVYFVTKNLDSTNPSVAIKDGESDGDSKIEFFEILVPVPSSFVTLGIQNGISAMQTGDVVTYEIAYKNTSDRTLRDGILYIELPEDLNYLDATRGDYSTVDHAVSYEFGVIGVGESGRVFVTMELSSLEDSRVPVIAMAQLVHQNPDSNAREGATAYDVDTRYHNLSEENAEALVASVFGAVNGGGTLFAVLLSLLAITMIVYYLQISGYMNRKKLSYAYEPVRKQEESNTDTDLFESEELVSDVKESSEFEIPHPPALIDEVYEGHLGS